MAFGEPPVFRLDPIKRAFSFYDRISGEKAGLELLCFIASLSFSGLPWLWSAVNLLQTGFGGFHLRYGDGLRDAHSLHSVTSDMI